MVPDGRSGNPYQQLLAASLERQGVRVAFAAEYPPLLPLFREVRRQGVDVLHLHWLDQLALRPSLLASLLFAARFVADVALTRMSGTKVVWTVHNLVSHEARFPGLEVLLYRLVGMIADQVLVHHHCARPTVRKLYGIPDHKLEVTPLGHYRGVYRGLVDQRSARDALELPAHGLVYLHQGLLRPYKGTDELLAAWTAVDAASAGHHLVIAGKATDPEYGKRLATVADQSQSVTFHDQFIEAERMHLYFSAADVVVLPFRRVLNSSSLILAMSYDRPVIAPRVDTLSETLGAAQDLLYDPADPEGLANAIRKSFHVDLPALSAAVMRSCDALAWDPIAARFAQLLRRLVGTPYQGEAHAAERFP